MSTPTGALPLAGADARTDRTRGRRPRCCRARPSRRARARCRSARQVGKLHRHRARRLEPDQARRSADRARRATPDPSDRRSDARCPSRASSWRAKLLARAVGVVGDQQLVAAFSSAMSTSVIAARPLGTSSVCRPPSSVAMRSSSVKRRRRAVQAVGVAGLLLPVARAQRGGVGEDDRRRLVHRRLHRAEAGRRPVGVRDQRGAAPRRPSWSWRHRRASDRHRRPGRGRRRRRCARA